MYQDPAAAVATLQVNRFHEASARMGAIAWHVIYVARPEAFRAMIAKSGHQGKHVRTALEACERIIAASDKVFAIRCQS